LKLSPKPASDPRNRPRKPTDDVLPRRPWQVLSLLWRLLDNILLPLSSFHIDGLTALLSRIVERLEHYHQRKLRPRQLDRLRSIFSQEFG